MCKYEKGRKDWTINAYQLLSLGNQTEEERIVWKEVFMYKRKGRTGRHEVWFERLGF